MGRIVEFAFDTIVAKRRLTAPDRHLDRGRLSPGRRYRLRRARQRLSHRRAFAVWAVASASLWGLGYIVLAQFIGS